MLSPFYGGKGGGRVTREEAINLFVKIINTCPKEPALTKNEIKTIEKYYRDNFSLYLTFGDFYHSSEEIKALLDKSDAVKQMIKKQIREERALQPGVLSECVCTQYIASVMGCKTFVDITDGDCQALPIRVRRFFDCGASGSNIARYVYYKQTKRKTTMIVQYGNPQQCDAKILFKGHVISIEMKNLPALLLDTDLMYDEDGKLLAPDKIEENLPCMMSLIDDFNAKTNVFAEMGKNYRLFAKNQDMDKRMQILEEGFAVIDSDIVLVWGGPKEEIVAIKYEDMNHICKDGTALLSTDGSEIRMTGKNYRLNVFTPRYLEMVMRENEIELLENGMCRLYKDNDKVFEKGNKKGRGKSVCTRFKLSNSFFIRPEHMIYYDDYVEFPYENIAQNKTGIALHINLKKTKEEIMKELSL